MTPPEFQSRLEAAKQRAIETYGPKAGEALNSALNLVNGNTQKRNISTSVATDLIMGNPVSPDKLGQLQEENNLGTFSRMIRGLGMGSQPAASPGVAQAVQQRSWPKPPPEAIEKLRKNPSSDEAFSQIYGPLNTYMALKPDTQKSPAAR